MHFQRVLLPSLLVLCLATASTEAADVESLIKQLDADKFSERKSATEQLIDMDAAAIPAVKEAAESDSPEVATRCFSILQRHFEEGDEETKQAAEAALQQLANGDGKAARKAKHILTPEPEPNETAQLVPPRIIIGAPVMPRLQIRQAALNGQRIQVRIVNGVKDVTVEDNGRKIHINEDPNNGIKIEVTEKKDGQETTKKYEAKDLAELKKKHPEAYKLYEKHGKQNGVIQIRAARPPAPPRPQPRVAQVRKDHFDRMKKNLDDQIERLEKQAEQADEVRQQHYQRMVENLKRHRKAIEEMEKRHATPQVPAP